MINNTISRWNTVLIISKDYLNLWTIWANEYLYMNWVYLGIKKCFAPTWNGIKEQTFCIRPNSTYDFTRFNSFKVINTYVKSLHGKVIFPQCIRYTWACSWWYSYRIFVFFYHSYTTNCLSVLTMYKLLQWNHSHINAYNQYTNWYTGVSWFCIQNT